MAESVLASPLDALELPAADGIARVLDAGATARLVLRAGSEAAGRIGTALELDLLGRVNTASDGASCAALRIGPDEWLLIADAQGDPWLAARIAEAAGGLPVSVADVTHRNAGIHIEGPEVEAVLAAGCPLPLGLDAFPLGRATRTLLAKAEVVLWRRMHDRFHLEVGRSFAPYLVAFLAEAIASEAAIKALQGR